MAVPVLELRNLTKEIPAAGQEPFVIFKNISLTVNEGEFVSIVGPSGCGKTTMLRVINGLLTPSSGQIFIDGKKPPQEAGQIARSHLNLVGLSGFENHYPHQLSGGMQQRVNLARALAVDPRILLM